MSLKLNRFYDEIDRLFEGKKASEKLIIYSMPLIVFSFLSYQFLYPLSISKVATKKAHMDALEKELKNTTALLNSKDETIKAIEQNEANNKALSAKLKIKIDENSAIKQKFLSVSFANMDEKNSLDFVNYLTTMAAKNGVKISGLRAKIVAKERGVFKKELIADINCSGSYSGALSYINDIESSKMFSKIDSCNIKSGAELNVSICVKVSGI